MSRSPARLEEYAVRLRGGEILLVSPQAVLDVLRSLRQAVTATRQNGYAGAVAPRVEYLLALLADAAEVGGPLAASGNAEVPESPDVPTSTPMNDPVTAADAAELLGVGRRQVRNLAEQLEGQRVGGRWVFERATVDAERRRRDQGRQTA